MKIRRFAESDMPAVLAIQGECAQAAQWHEQDYTRLAQDPAGLLLVAEVEPPTLDASASAVAHKDQRPSARSGVAGFAAFYTLIDEAELRNLAVARAHQRRGTGKALLEDLPAALPVDVAELPHGPNGPVDAFDDKAGHALFKHLGD